MSEKKQTKEQRKSLLSQRFGERTVETGGRKRGRPAAKVYRKNASFFLQPEVLEELDQAYHRRKAEQTGFTRAEFREALLRDVLAREGETRHADE